MANVDGTRLYHYHESMETIERLRAENARLREALGACAHTLRCLNSAGAVRGHWGAMIEDDLQASIKALGGSNE